MHAAMAISLTNVERATLAAELSAIDSNDIDSTDEQARQYQSVSVLVIKPMRLQ